MYMWVVTIIDKIGYENIRTIISVIFIIKQIFLFCYIVWKNTSTSECTGFKL